MAGPGPRGVPRATTNGLRCNLVAASDAHLALRAISPNLRLGTAIKLSGNFDARDVGERAHCTSFDEVGSSSWAPG